MLIEVQMPVLGLTMEEGTIIEWTKAVGDKVAADETLLVVETDKAASDVPSPAAGILACIVADEGETVPVKQLIAYLAETEADLLSVPGDRSAAEMVQASPSTEVVPSPPALGLATPSPAQSFQSELVEKRSFASPRARARAAALGVNLADVPHEGVRIVEQDVIRAAESVTAVGTGVRFTPLAARLAAELGIDLAALAGSAEARVRAADLLLAASMIPDRPGAASLDTPLAETPETRSPGRVRRITAERMTLSSQTAPQVTYQMRCDMTRAVQFRSDLKPMAEARGIKLSFDAMFVRAVATALMEFPDVNSQWVEGEGIRTFPHAHVGVAVDLGEDGLIVPVIRNADSLSLLAVAAELERLVKLAREGKLGPDDYKEGTFTITNLGLLGVETFNPIINLPEAAILAIGAITSTIVPKEGRPTERQMTTLALTTDHRVLDGAPSARFLGRVRALMEQPLALVEKEL